jgi:hypothetical protein
MTVPRGLEAEALRVDPSLTYPFVDVGGRALVLQAAFSPITFATLSRNQIAAGLDDTASPVTQSVIASANDLSAAFCLADGERPGSVCGSSGVASADRALHVAR